jgi:hypothetical protein
MKSRQARPLGDPRSAEVARSETGHSAVAEVARSETGHSAGKQKEAFESFVRSVRLDGKEQGNE